MLLVKTSTAIICLNVLTSARRRPASSGPTFGNKVVSRAFLPTARIFPSSHTNPLFVIVDGQPIRASRRSAEWCLAAVNQCWTQKAPRIAPGELEEARKAYDHARDVYRRLIAESPPGS